jgi:protein TonB
MLAGCVSTDPTVYKAEQLTKDAKPIVRIVPKYPKGINGVDGYVKAKLIIDETGNVSKVELLESVPEGIFDSEALRVLRRWRYKAAELNGKPVKTSKEVQLDWNANK